MKKIFNAIKNAILERLATIIISAIFAGVGVCWNHSKISEAKKWIGEDLSKHTERMNQIESNTVDQNNWMQFQIDDTYKIITSK